MLAVQRLWLLPLLAVAALMLVAPVQGRAWNAEVALHEAVGGEDESALSDLTAVSEDEETGELSLDADVLASAQRFCRRNCVYGKCSRWHVKCENRNSAYRLGLRQLRRCRRQKKGNRQCPGWNWKCRGSSCRWHADYGFWRTKLNQVRMCQGTWISRRGFTYRDPKASKLSKAKARLKGPMCRHKAGVVSRGGRIRSSNSLYRMRFGRRRRRRGSRGLWGRRRKRRRRRRRSRKRRRLYGRRRRRRRRRGRGRGRKRRRRFRLGGRLRHWRNLRKTRRAIRRAKRRSKRERARARLAYIRAIKLRKRALAARKRYARLRRRLRRARSQSERRRLARLAQRLRRRMARATKIFRLYRHHVRGALRRSKFFRSVATPFFNSGPNEASVSEAELDAEARKYTRILDLARELTPPDESLASKRARQALRNQITVQSGRQAGKWIHWLIHNYIVGKIQREKKAARVQRKPSAYALDNLPPRGSGASDKSTASPKKKSVQPPAPGVERGSEIKPWHKVGPKIKAVPWNVDTVKLAQQMDEADPENFNGHLKHYNPGHAPGTGAERDPASEGSVNKEQWRITTGLEKQPGIKGPHFYPDEQRDTTADASAEFVKQGAYWNGPDAEFAPRTPTIANPDPRVPPSGPTVVVHRIAAAKKAAAAAKAAAGKGKGKATTALGEGTTITSKASAHTASKQAAAAPVLNTASLNDDQSWTSVHKEDPMHDDA